MNSSRIRLAAPSLARPLALLLTAGLLTSGTSSLLAAPAQAAGAAGVAHVAAPSGTVQVAAPSGITLPAAAKRNGVWFSLSAKSVYQGAKVKAKVTLKKRGKKASGTVRLQARIASGRWVLVKKIKVRRGSGTATFTAKVTRPYRVVYGSWKSAQRKVIVKKRPTVPKSFTITGSGFGHGIGMSQYGAYQLALSGRSVESILGTYYRGAKVGYRSVPGDSRVQLFQGSKSDIYIKGGRAKLAGPGIKAPGTIYPAATTFKLRPAAGGAMSVYRGSALLGTLPKGQRLAVMWENTRYFAGPASAIAYVRKAGSSSSATHGYYRYGRFEVMNISGKVNVVNVLKTNTEYLYGLGEMPSYWGRGKGSAALQAQAVAARNYALISSAYKPTCDCNLYDDVRSQYFSGYRKEASEGGQYWRAAVNATAKGSAGKVMTVGGKLVQAYYFSASGGATLNSEDVWSSSIPYLRSVKDPYSLRAPGNSNATWRVTLSQARAKKIFKLRNVVAIKVVSRYRGGAAKTVRATDSLGRHAYVSGKSDSVRFTFGLKAAWIRSFTRSAG